MHPEVEDCGPAEICPELAGVHFLSLDSQNPFLLWELEPQYVIMYDLDVEFLRQLEVFKVRYRPLAQLINCIAVQCSYLVDWYTQLVFWCGSPG